MKKVLGAAILVAATLSLNAQSKIKSSFGIKGGVNNARFEIKDEDSDWKTLWHAGLLAHVHVADKFAIQPELVFSKTGGSRQIAAVKYEDYNSYLTVPVLFQFMAGTGFRIEAGPQIGFLLKAKQKANGTESDTKDFYKTTDVSLVGGLSYLTNSGLGFDARYVYGLTDISNSDNVGAGGNFHVKNRVIQAGIFYQFKN
ncbi:MAG TPA: porin family protein [Flavitalea sp.]|nr:porin family protein [Flavitalea sp.]